MALTVDIVFNGFKNQDDIKSLLSSVQLGPTTVTRRIEAILEDVH